ncbi:protein translocase subunit SecD [Candidatus Shapirobacteria bacterium CG_4_9_14_0_2_um_filter_40_11]|uniref:Protein translocase subunit SecD n=1 Tax=Candidatus Shapirobacteria bacterium CG_4_9_14_0_2_um_filter_40_11 TaxID=1974876 RepID=A0A2M8EV90_9BACT|nr:MAG: protein translocase subunit SecD [Candidatus Shapirobacteria bacterium CG_4_9_14_0_2_um_filter_40_11]
MKKRKNILWLIITLTLFSVYVDLPAKLNLRKEISFTGLDFKIGPIVFKRPTDVKKGLDLQGGTHLVFSADMNGVEEKNRDEALKASQTNIEKRVNYFGVSEAIVQTAKTENDFRLIVELPGVTDVNQAIDLIGKTAQLEFRTENPDQKTATESGEYFLKTDLTGKDLKRSFVDFDQNTSEPVVGLEFNSEGAKKFGEITAQNVGKMVAIYLDGLPVSIPKVEEAITGGNAVIRGSFDLKSAKQLSIQLNAGALPVPISLIEQRNIGASLGNESVQKSVRAGLIGLLMVIAFMWAYYGKLGLLADLALINYGLITLALYKLIPVTLTLPGIAGFLLSVGMAVDANILIFERMKEEKRMGKPLLVAMELGFGRAWDSIRDANVCTLITAFILFNPFNWTFLNVSGMVRGFALTLALGIAVSLFTGIVVTRTLIRVFYKR